MIVGRGLIAKAFFHSVFDTAGYVVFASGVSNSAETRQEAFEREINLLDSVLTKDKTIIYFSTTSLFDPTKTASPYILHKRFMEEHITRSADKSVIVRLPILIGDTENPYTLINFLVRAIQENRPIPLHLHACRHLLDIDDLVPQLQKHLDPLQQIQWINIPGSEKLPVPELVHKIEALLGKAGTYTWEPVGSCYDVPENAGKTVYLDEPGYIDRILHKYLKSPPAKS